MDWSLMGTRMRARSMVERVLGEAEYTNFGFWR